MVAVMAIRPAARAMTGRGVVGVIVGFLGLAVSTPRTWPARRTAGCVCVAGALLSPFVSAISNVAIKRWARDPPFRWPGRDADRRRGDGGRGSVMSAARR